MVCSFVTNDLSFRFKVAASRLCWEKCKEEKVSQQPVYTKPMYCSFCGKLDGSEVKNPPANEGDSRSIPGSGRSPGEGNGNSLQYARLKHPTGRGAWWATIHGGHKEPNTAEWLSSQAPRLGWQDSGQKIWMCFLLKSEKSLQEAVKEGCMLFKLRVCWCLGNRQKRNLIQVC